MCYNENKNHDREWSEIVTPPSVFQIFPLRALLNRSPPSPQINVPQPPIGSPPHIYLKLSQKQQIAFVSHTLLTPNVRVVTNIEELNASSQLECTNC